MHSKSDNIKITINDKADKVIEELFQYFLSGMGWKHQWKVVISYFIVFIFYRNISGCKINLKRARSYVDSPDWIKSKKAPIFPFNEKDSKWF